MSRAPTPATGDRGSIPLVLLVVIALSAVMIALVTSAVAGSRATRFDEAYTTVLHAADTGAQEGATRLLRANAVQTLADEPVPAGCTPSTPETCPVFDSGTGAVLGTPYAWEARKVAPLEWHVRSTATAGDVTRVVVQEVADDARFFVAAFSDHTLTMRGGNQADSYGSGVWFTGNGIIASNETITLNGGSTGVDAVHLYDWDANPDLNRCRHQGGNDCDDVLAQPDAVAPSARIGPRLEVGGDRLPTQFIDDQLADCPVNPPQDYTASTHDGGSGVLGTPGTETVLCFASFTVDRDVTVEGTVDIYVYGDVSVHNHTTLNCGDGCTAGTSDPDATTLTIYVDGVDPDHPSTVALGNHSDVVAGVYAPESDCEGNPSNAQADVFGSMICGSISNQGGWSFHYDDRLGTEGTGAWDLGGWREEQP